MSDKTTSPPEEQIEVPDSVDADLPRSRLTVPESVDTDRFFRSEDGTPTLTNHGDLEKTVPNEDKEHLHELERTWLNKPFAFSVIYKNESEQDLRYFVVEPVLSDTEEELVEFLKEKLEFSIERSTIPAEASAKKRADIIREEALELMDRYDLIKRDEVGHTGGVSAWVKRGIIGVLRRRAQKRASEDNLVDPVPVDRDEETGERQKLDDEQIEKIIYYLIRDFVRYGKIDPFKQDPNIEDISANGYNERVFVYQTQHGQMITNVSFGEQELDEFVIELAQTAGKGISKRNPSVDATLEDGSRAELELGYEVSDFGTNFTIRQFKEVPFTPVDLVNWKTFSLEEMVYFWLAVENNKNIIVSGGTASGKTTTLNALSLFVDSNSKIVSLEDTRELLIPHKNWVANTTRESFRQDDDSDIGMYQLLRDALRKRPDYIIVGEVRGEEGRTLFQAMNSGHTVFTTFHANKPEEVLTRFVEEPINVSRSMMQSIDIILTQRDTNAGGRTVRRCTDVLEIDNYNGSKEGFQTDKTFDWNNDTDEHIFRKGGQSDLMEEIRRDRGWSETEFAREQERRKTVLSYLIDEGLNSYAAVAATLQAYMNSPETVLQLIATDQLAERVGSLKSMKTIDVQVDPKQEALVPRPGPSPEVQETVDEVLADKERFTSLQGAEEEPSDGAIGETAKAVTNGAGPDKEMEAEAEQDGLGVLSDPSDDDSDASSDPFEALKEE